MGISHRLEMRQGQSLVMTPQLLQAIKLLQLSSLELTAYVETELERNPLLERDERGDDGGPSEPEMPATRDDGEPRSGDWLDSDMGSDRGAIEDRMGTRLDNVFPDEPAERAPAGGAAEDMLPVAPMSWATGGGGGQAWSDDDPNLEAYCAAQLSLQDHLSEQLALTATDPVERLIGRELVDMIDDAGYLQGDLAELAERLGADPARVATVLARIHACDPTGVGARSLAECLSLQLAERDRLDPAMKALIDHLPLVAKRDYAALKRVCRVDDEDLADMLGELRRLDPKPGLRFGSSVAQSVVPDVYIRAASDGSWRVELNSAVLPRVLVNQTYHAKISRNARNETDKAFITDCLQTANWLTRSLEQRARTILTVASEIVTQQDGFFAYGVEFLRPLNLRTIADAIGMHESTVSRVTSNKYMATPRGLFEMKYFFTASIASADGGDAYSAEAVRYKIKQMIDAEVRASVLSDDAIVQQLKAGGVEIARRTVAKYRESMNIPSSMERRREKTAMAGGRA